MDDNKRATRRGSSFTEISYEHEGLLFEARISDLSQGGLFIDTLNPLAQGSTITFRFSLPGRGGEFSIVGEGVVAWQRLFQGMGIRFTWLSDEDKEQIEYFLSRNQ